MVVNHGDGHPLAPPFERETGVLVQTDQEGRELRLHEASRGAWEPYEWRWNLDGGRPICARRFYLAPAEWIACGRAMEAVGSTP